MSVEQIIENLGVNFGSAKSYYDALKDELKTYIEWSTNIPNDTY